MRQKNPTIKYPIKVKMTLLAVMAAVPFLAVVIYLMAALINYRNVYDSIVSNMTVANSYNLNFKEEMDESLYKLVVGYITFDEIGQDESLKDPYAMIAELRSEFGNLMKITTDGESRVWLQSLLRNIDTLEDRVDDIHQSLDNGGSYDDNIVMLENNIYIMTELVQDDIQYYIYYQTKSIEHLTDSLNEQVHSFVLFCIGLVAFVVLAVLIFTVIMVRGITRPVQELYRVTGEISEGNLSVRARVDSNDEIKVLSDSVNDMAENLETLVEKIKEDERRMRRADLRLLQEQINPHFLYNTLDTIVWLIEGNNSERAVNMVVSLSEFFRLVLSKGKEYITIQEEELHIKSYLEIQQVRYQDILDYEIHIDPALYQYKILKLTLQPLVENSLYHGIKYKRARGLISVNGSLKGEKVFLEVRDNGVGMEEEELMRLRREIQRPCQETEQGFGLANVNERIRMNFGAEYGMTIDSEKGKGTCVKIVIPAVYYGKMDDKHEA